MVRTALAALAVGAALVMSALFGVPGAAAAPSVVGPNYWCDYQGGSGGLCVSYNDGTGNGDDITNWAWGSGKNTVMDVVLDGSACNNGKVSSATDCPFSDSSLDSKYNGNDIWTIYNNSDTSACLGTNDSLYVVVRSCPGGSGNTTGSLWVTANQIASFVDVYGSDYAGSAQFLCGDAVSGDIMSVFSYSANYCQWGWR